MKTERKYKQKESNNKLFFYELVIGIRVLFFNVYEFQKELAF